MVAISDGQKNIVQRYVYESFGLASAANPAFANPYLFTGREWDPELGLYYYRARYYDPMEGRFVSKDPIGFAGGDVNVYRYVLGNVANFIDPSGLISGASRTPGLAGTVKFDLNGDTYLYQFNYSNSAQNYKLLKDARDYYCGDGGRVVSIMLDSATIISISTGQLELLPCINGASRANFVANQVFCGPTLTPSTATSIISLMAKNTEAGQIVNLLSSSVDLELNFFRQ